MHSLYLIAEIGINHDGRKEKAQKLVEAAANAGFDAVKFQIRNPERCVPSHMRNMTRETIWGNLSYIEYRRKMELDWSFYDIISSNLPEGLDWLASAWDRDSIAFLERSSCKFIKVPSAYAGVNRFVELCQATNKPLIVSIGGIDFDSILDRACSMYRNAWIAHCVSLYPPHEKEHNLAWITRMKQALPTRTIGYSCHTPNLAIPALAVAAGAQFIEVHVTEDRADPGSDHAISFQIDELKTLVETLRSAAIMLGSEENKAIERQHAKLSTLMSDDF